MRNGTEADKLQAATSAVEALETAAGKDLTVEANLTAAEAAVIAANTAVEKVAAGEAKTALEGKVTTATGTVEAARTTFDKAAADASITLAISELSPSLNGDADTATSLTLGTATQGTTLEWSSSNTAILTDAGAGVNDATGGTAVLTAKVNKTVNGQAGTEQTKLYDVVVNDDGTLKSITAK